MEYAAEFTPSAEGDEEQGSRFFWQNSRFSYSDAMSCYCFMRKLKPRTVVEIGGGFSTLVTREVLGRNGLGRVVCVEPFPRPFLTTTRPSSLCRVRLRTFRQRGSTSGSGTATWWEPTSQSVSASQPRCFEIRLE